MAMISGLRPLSPFWLRKAPYLPSEAVLYNSLSGALNLPVRRSRSQAEPLAPRGVSPGGAINPRTEGPSTFGNTVKRRFLLKAYCLRGRRRKAVYKMAPQGAVPPQRSGTI